MHDLRHWLNIVAEAATKEGKEVDLKYFIDTHGDNRGFTIDRIDAMIDGTVAGYLKIENIPSENFALYYPSILNYLSQIAGTHILPFGHEADDYRKLSDFNLLKILKTLEHIELSWSRYLAVAHKDRVLDRGQMLGVIKHYEQALKKKYGKAFADFRNWHVDKPFIAYIRVEDAYLRQGIGTMLYFAGARWMESRGMHLYASKVQSPEAEAIWRQLLPHSATDKRGRYLVPPKSNLVSSAGRG